MELAKNEIRAQYEANYFDARKSLGKYIADSLFPKVERCKSKSEEGDIDSETDE
jgi:hypothetical protein